MSKRMSGVLSPVVTPFKSDGSPDAVRFERQCRWLLANHVGKRNEIVVTARLDSDGGTLNLNRTSPCLGHAVCPQG